MRKRKIAKKSQTRISFRFFPYLFCLKGLSVLRPFCTAYIILNCIPLKLYSSFEKEIITMFIMWCLNV